VRAVLQAREEEPALFVCRILDGRPEGKGVLPELDRAGIRRDVIRFGGGRGGRHGSLRGFFSAFCAGRIDVDRAGTRDPLQFSLHPERIPVQEARASPQTFAGSSAENGAARAANVGNICLLRKAPYLLSHGGAQLGGTGQECTRNKSPLAISPIFA
jgi:hypothetical protein